MTHRALLALVVMLPLLYAGPDFLSAQVIRLPAADAVLTARPRVIHTLGAEDGEDGEVFAHVADVAFDSRDNLYVLDQGNARVVVFDSAGRHLRTFGRRGRGPGELTLPQRMTVTLGDEVVVSDPGRRAFSVFGADGGFRRSVPFAQVSVLAGAKLEAHPRGGVVSFYTQGPGSGLPARRLLWQPLGRGAATTLFTGRDDAPGERGRVFSPSVRFAVLPGGGLAVAGTEAYSVRVTGPNGSAARVLQRAIAPRRVTEQDRQWERERREAFTRPGGITIVGAGADALPASTRAQAALLLQQQVEFAAVMPVIQALEADAAGNLWIQRAGPSPDRPGPIDLVTPQGRYLGTLRGVPLPAAFSARGRAAYTETDALGVARVVVLRLPPRWR